VRRTWQIDAGHIHLTGHSWPNTLNAIVSKATAGLGV
jgi:hypothetical protein